MLLLAINAFKWIQANWKLVAIAAILGGAFYSGWAIRGYIAEAAQNKAIALAIQETKAEEKKLYDQAIQLEKRKRAIREKARVANTDIYKATGDSCSDSLIPDSWMRIIQSAYDNSAS